MLAQTSVQVPEDFSLLLTAHIYSVCPTAIPTLPSPADGCSELELMESLGMQKDKKGEYESFDRFLARTEGLISLMGEIMSSSPSGHTLLGGQSGALLWLERFLDLLPPEQTPLPLLTAPVLVAFLTAAGHMLMNKFPEEFTPLFHRICNDIVKRLDTSTIGQPSATRLSKLLVGGVSSLQKELPHGAIREFYDTISTSSNLFCQPTTNQPLLASSSMGGNTSKGMDSQSPFDAKGSSTFSSTTFGASTANVSQGFVRSTPMKGNAPISFGTIASTPLPGPGQTTISAPSPFGRSAPSTFGGSSNQPNATTQNAPSPSPFGVTNTPAPSPFTSVGASSPFGTATSSNSVGQTAFSKPSPFGGGQNTMGGNPSPFGSGQSNAIARNPSPFDTVQNNTLGGTQFPAGATQSNTFGNTSLPFGSSQNTVFGSTSSSFGGGQNAAFHTKPSPFASSQNTSISSNPSPFGTGQSSFGNNPSPFGVGQNNTFGSNPSPFGAGQNNTFGSNPSPFGAGQSTIGTPSPFGVSNNTTNFIKDKKEPCKYFAQGKCKYGASCKYSHDVSRNLGTNVASPFGQAQNTSVSPFGNTGWNDSSNKTQPCKFFAEGKCRFGANCKFCHDTKGFVGFNNSANTNTFGTTQRW
jgi:GLE1-like protein./Zinc finger C-x8-C-x5-C-x3-H type (and similar).